MTDLNPLWGMINYSVKNKYWDLLSNIKSDPGIISIHVKFYTTLKRDDTFHSDTLSLYKSDRYWCHRSRENSVY